MEKNVSGFGGREIIDLRKEIIAYIVFSMRSDTDVRDWDRERKEVVGMLEKKGLKKVGDLFRDYCNAQLNFADKIEEQENARREYKKAENDLLRYLGK